ncbi:MAG TPA: class I SAM-dependent methyltransferase [Longimicrobiales bacterium]
MSRPLPPSSPDAFDRRADGLSPLDDPRAAPDAAARIALLRSLCTGRERVLEVGCGTGINLVALADRIVEGVGVDFAPRTIERARAIARRHGAANLRFAVGDARGLDAVRAADGPFHLIILAGVLEHIPERRCVLRACRRRLTRGGRLVVIMPHPANPGFLWRRLVQRRSPRIFASDLHLRPTELRGLARAAGLAPVTVRPLPFLPTFDDGPDIPARVRPLLRAFGILPHPATRGAYAMVLRRSGHGRRGPGPP